MADTAQRDTTIKQNVAFEFLIGKIRRGLNDGARKATSASVSFTTEAGVAAGGPYPAVLDAEVNGWVAQCPARTENVDTVLVSIASWVINGVTYTQNGTLRIT